jgi:hypothetical protein
LDHSGYSRILSVASRLYQFSILSLEVLNLSGLGPVSEGSVVATSQPGLLDIAGIGMRELEDTVNKPELYFYQS